jgi:hypothetical protein
MQEIIIPEIVIVFLLVAPLIRPFVRRLWPLDGLVWLPAIALAVAIALFPAYGFRLEAIPLLICTAVIAIRSLPALLVSLGRQYKGGYEEPGPTFTLVSLVLLMLGAGFALYFSPFYFPPITGIRTLEIEGQGLLLRVYGHDDPQVKRPLMFLVPPEAGSLDAVDKVSGKLRDQGFVVLSFSRPGFDALSIGEGEKIHSPGRLFSMFRAAIWGASTKAANTIGAEMEQQRKEDVRFLLGYLRGHPDLVPEADPNSMFLVGYSAGGSALAFLAGEPSFGAENPGVKGLILVESPLWSAYTAEERTLTVVPDDALWGRAALIRVQNWFAGLSSLKINGIGAVPSPTLPLLFIVSDKVTNLRCREERYGPILRIMDSSPAVLVAVEGAGILDYSDYPLDYPLYSALNPGQGEAGWTNMEYIEGTAVIMADFASLFVRDRIPERKIRGAFHIETGKAWNWPEFRGIFKQ